MRLFLKILLPSLLLVALPGGAAEDNSRPTAAAIARACAGCHGPYGQGFASIPALTGIPETEFVRRMKAFRDGQRSTTVMDRIARGYRDEDFAALAHYFNHH